MDSFKFISSMVKNATESGRKRQPRKRVDLCISIKLNIIQDIEKGLSHESITNRYGITSSHLFSILRRQADIIRDFNNFGRCERKRIAKKTKYDIINQLTYKWVSDNGFIISGSLIQQKALSIAREHNISEFRASNGWLECFRKRYQLLNTGEVSASKMKKPFPMNLSHSYADMGDISNNLNTSTCPDAYLLNSSCHQMRNCSDNSLSFNTTNSSGQINADCGTNALQPLSQNSIKMVGFNYGKEKGDKGNFKSSLLKNYQIINENYAKNINKLCNITYDDYLKMQEFMNYNKNVMSNPMLFSPGQPADPLPPPSTYPEEMNIYGLNENFTAVDAAREQTADITEKSNETKKNTGRAKQKTKPDNSNSNSNPNSNPDSNPNSNLNIPSLAEINYNSNYQTYMNQLQKMGYLNCYNNSLLSQNPLFGLPDDHNPPGVECDADFVNHCKFDASDPRNMALFQNLKNYSDLPFPDVIDQNNFFLTNNCPGMLDQDEEAMINRFDALTGLIQEQLSGQPPINLLESFPDSNLSVGYSMAALPETEPETENHLHNDTPVVNAEEKTKK